MRKLGLVVAVVLLMTACSSTVKTGHAPSDTTIQAPTVASKAAGSTAAALPLGAVVTSGPLGGRYCDLTAAHWSAQGSGIRVFLSVDGPSDVSIQAVNAANDPLGSGAGKIADGMHGTVVDIPHVSADKVAGVSVAVAGAVSGICDAQGI